MEQRSICLFLARKWLTYREIHNELIAVLGSDAVAYSTVTKYLRNQHLSLLVSKLPENSASIIIEGAILDALNKQPFSSIRELAQLTCIPRTTVYRHLTKSLGFEVKHLHWVPHELTTAQKRQHIALSRQLLQDLLSIKHHGWQFIITLDESWFYFATAHEQIWLQPGQTPPERPKHTIGDKKIMVTIAWNPLRFHLVTVLPKGMTFNADYYRDNILSALTEYLPESEERHLVIHADNARPHTAEKCRIFCEENGLRLVTHPPYSPDLAPSDFFLFGHVKNRLQGRVFESQDDLVAAITEELQNIELETLHRVFEHWMERLVWVCQNNGNYYP
jgi:transposase